jgi:hypothetical protein
VSYYERPSSIRFPRPLRERIERRAVQERQSFSNVVRLLVEDGLSREPGGSALAGEKLGAERLVAQLADRGLDVAAIAGATGLDVDDVGAVVERGR